MPVGFRNPLTVGASGQSDGSAYRALADSMAASNMQAGPNTWMSVLQGILGPLAQSMNLNRAAEADAAFEDQRLKKYEEYQAREAEAERKAQETAAGATAKSRAEIAARLLPNDPIGQQRYVDSGELPTAPKPQGLIRVGDQVFDPTTRKVVYDAPDAPQAPRQRTEYEDRRDWLKQNDPEGYKRFMAGTTAAAPARTPSGYMRGEDGRLAYEPGGPADPETIATRQQVASAAKQEPGINDALAAFQNMRNLVAEHGTEQLPFGENKAKMKAAYGAARDAIRVLSNSGVLNVGELPYLEERLNDPTAWTSLRAGPILSQIDENVAMLEAKKGRLGELRGGGQQAQGGQTKAGPVGSVITGPDGKRYRVVGGDPNDPDLEPVG